MRANQPMGLPASAQSLLEGRLALPSGRFYEGYWDERYQLVNYLAPDAALSALLVQRATLEAEMAKLEAAIETEGQRQIAAGADHLVEFEQAVLYSSGPCMFLGLRDQDGRSVAGGLWGECAMGAAAEGECFCRGEECLPDCPYACRTVKR